jgi:hypothetical protein
MSQKKVFSRKSFKMEENSTAWSSREWPKEDNGWWKDLEQENKTEIT